MVNINITLPDDLHKQIKIAAASNDKTIKELINEALERRVQKKRKFLVTNINITIPDDLHKQLKVAAAIEEKSLKDVVIETLESYMNAGGVKK